jgi:hypothetical protein
MSASSRKVGNKGAKSMVVAWLSEQVLHSVSPLPLQPLAPSTISRTGTNRVQTWQTSLPERSGNSAQPSIRVPARPRESETSKDNTEGEMRNQASRSRPANTPRTPTFHGRNTSYAGSIYSASSSRPKKCILDDEELGSELMGLVDRLLSNKPNPNGHRHEGLMYIKLKDEMISFYDAYAYGPADHPSEASLLAEISRYRPPDTIVIVDAVDKMYFEAGWRLKRRPLEESCSPILDAPHSSPSLPRPKGKTSQYRAPPA